MFYEKGISGDCYKNSAKWDLPFDKEEAIQELIGKRRIEGSKFES